MANFSCSIRIFSSFFIQTTIPAAIIFIPSIAFCLSQIDEILILQIKQTYFIKFLNDFYNAFILQIFWGNSININNSFSAFLFFLVRSYLVKNSLLLLNQSKSNQKEATVSFSIISCAVLLFSNSL